MNFCRKLKLTKFGILKIVIVLIYVFLIFLIQDDKPSIQERIKMHCERIDNDEDYRLKVAVNRYFHDILLELKKDKNDDECNPNPNNRFPNLMDCELSVTGKNIDKKTLNEFIGNLILQNNMRASSSDLHDAFIQYSENILSQIDYFSLGKLDFMDILDNYNIMYFFYGTRLFLYEKSSFTLEGDKKKQLVIHSKAGYSSDSRYMWDTIKNIKAHRYNIVNCGRLQYLSTPQIGK